MIQEQELTDRWPPDDPIEVWLSQDNMVVTCRVVFEDESVTDLHVDSLSLRGAEREITGHLIAEGLKPAGRWQAEDNDGREVSRRFTPAKG
jgi:hypothetical protein